MLSRLCEGLPGERDQYEDYAAAVQATLDTLPRGAADPEQILEGEFCTVLLIGHGGLPHGAVVYLCVYYRDGSYLGDGMRLTLPVPRTGVMNSPHSPDELSISEDGRTLRYSYVLPQPIITFENRVLQPAGSYRYMTDLNSGLTWLDFSAPEE